MPAKAIARLFICKTHIGNHTYSFYIILIWTIQNVVYYRTHNCISSAGLDVFCFFLVICHNNISEQIKRLSESEASSQMLPLKWIFQFCCRWCMMGLAVWPETGIWWGSMWALRQIWQQQPWQENLAVFRQFMKPTWHLQRHVRGHMERTDGYYENWQRGARGESCRCFQFMRLIGAEGADITNCNNAKHLGMLVEACSVLTLCVFMLPVSTGAVHNMDPSFDYFMYRRPDWNWRHTGVTR